MTIARRTLKLALCAAVTALAAPAYAAWPDKPIRMVVPQPPGGFNDTVSRLLAQRLGEAWKQPVVVENMPGAGGQIGTAAAARAPADGYTLLVVSFAHATNPYLRKNLPYDTVKDFKPVALLGQTPNLLVVRADSAIKSTEDLLTSAKARPGKLSYGSSGAGTSPHLSMEMFKSMSKTDIVHIPYKGGAPMVNDLLGGQVDVVFDNVPNLLPFVKAGKLRALSVSSAQPTELAPGVQTTATSGVPGFEMQAWYGLVVPAGTPDDIVAKINAEVNAVLQMPDVKSIFVQQSVVPGGGSPRQFGDFVDAQMKKWAKVIQDANITLD